MVSNTRRPPYMKQDGAAGPKYCGLLSEPMPILISEQMEHFGQPGWFPGDGEDWKATLSRIRQHEHAEWSRREKALGALFGIEIDRALDMDDCWHRLAFALAEAHVPAFERGVVHYRYFKSHRAKTKPLKLSPETTFLLAAQVYFALVRGRATRDEIARYVVEFGIPYWRQGTPQDVARMPEFMAKQPSELARLSFNSARPLVAKTREAWNDCCRGRADTFQCQVIVLALSRASDDEGLLWRVVFGLSPPSSPKSWLEPAADLEVHGPRLGRSA